MRLLAVLLLVAPLSLRADALTDLRATLAQFAANTPAHGSFEVTSSSTNSDEGHAFEGKASVGFEVSDAGLRILYPKATLAQTNQEARLEAADPDRQTPARSGMSRVRALELADLLDAGAMLNIDLLNAQLIEAKATSYQAKPGHLIITKLSPKASKGSSKHVKSIDSRLSVWLGDDGVPIAAERNVSVKASFMLMSFEHNQKDNWTFARAGDRLVATHHEQIQKTDGFGQHDTSRVVQVVRLDM